MFGLTRRLRSGVGRKTRVPIFLLPVGGDRERKSLLRKIFFVTCHNLSQLATHDFSFALID